MYLEAFGPLIPIPTLALAITAVSNNYKISIHFTYLTQIKCVLDEQEDGSGQNLKFSAKRYERVYKTALINLQAALSATQFKTVYGRAAQRYFSFRKVNMIVPFIISV